MPLFTTAVRKRLFYYDTSALTTTSGVMTSYVLGANGLYDPNITGIGHQPVGFDQMMVFYDHYVVANCKCTVSFLNASTTNAPQVALSLNSTASPVSDPTILAESGFVVRDWLNLLGTNDSIKTMSLTCNISKFNGVPKTRDNPELWGTIASNPSEMSYFNLSIYDVSGGTSTVRFQFMLEFDVWFIEPRKITISTSKALHRLLVSEEKSSCK